MSVSDLGGLEPMKNIVPLPQSIESTKELKASNPPSSPLATTSLKSQAAGLAALETLKSILSPRKMALGESLTHPNSDNLQSAYKKWKSKGE